MNLQPFEPTPKTRPITLKKRRFHSRVYHTYRNYRVYMPQIGWLQAVYLTWLTTTGVPFDFKRTNKKRPAK